MKHLSKLITIIVCIFCSLYCKAYELSEQQTVAGVSKELATWRKANYNNIIYTLHFNINADRSQDISGHVDIAFSHNKNIPSVIDFRGDKNQIKSLTVNGKTLTDYTFKDEHIIINEKYLNPKSDVIGIDFLAGAKPLNRNDEFVYTLLVPDRARTLFPCFDQPNLKATYHLSLDVPESWIALSNTSVKSEKIDGGKRHVKFAPTEPLSTYLFSFVAGKFTRDERTRNGRTIAAYYRETDPDRLAQLDTIFSQVFDAIDWQENFTLVKYPFAKYDFVILPGFQFGGMEHTGATLYNDRVMFLGNHPTPTEELHRAQLIAHETSHMWFGDLVTMDWFDDVWTKEVFANYFAAAITEPTFPDINHTLARTSSFTTLALSEDRTEGTTAIQQPLDNLQNAGLVYNKIIYDKAPVVMFKIVELMGKDAYQRGIRDYVKKYSYSNATWDDLIACLDAQTTVDLQAFSNAWIKAKGMPTISIKPTDDGFEIKQTDPYGRGLMWPQSFSVKAIRYARSNSNDSTQQNSKQTIEREMILNVDMKDNCQIYKLGFSPDIVIPNYDCRGYGYFIPDNNTLLYIAENLTRFDEIARMSAVMTLYENYLHHRFDDNQDISNTFFKALAVEENPLIASELVGYLDFICTHSVGEQRSAIEFQMNELADTLSLQSARLQLQRKLCYDMTEPSIIAKYEQMWQEKSNQLWSENDYTTAAYELAVRLPEHADYILATQRSRISNADRLKQFDFVSRACCADTTKLDALFNSLADVKNRLIEPYAESVLYYLNHPCRDVYAARYIEPGLELLSEVQRTGDIFFPGRWAQMLLSNHRCNAARKALTSFLNNHPDYPTLLRNKIMLAAYQLTW